MTENIMEMAFDQTNQQLEHLNQLINDLEQFTNLDNINSKLTLEDQAKLNAALSFCLNSLYWVYMRTNGIDTHEHQINSEIQRIKRYFTKIQQTISNVKESKPQQTVQIDTQAVHRIITQQLRTNLDQQKEQKDIWDQKDKQIHKKISKGQQRLHKGALMAKAGHLNWKDKLDKIMKK